MNKIIFSFAFIFLMAFFLRAQDKVEPELRELGPNLFLTTVYGVNSLIQIGDEEIMLVDAGYDGIPLKNTLEEISDKKVNVIISTHWHYDHVTGLTSFREVSNSIAHENTLKLVSEDQYLLGDTIKALPEFARPQFTTTDYIDYFVNGEDVGIKALNGGHSGTDLIVYFKRSNVLHIGDLIFADMFPFIDVNHGGNVFKLIDDLNFILTNFPENTLVIPGHGRILSMQDVRDYLTMIESVCELVRTSRREGNTKEQMIKDNLLAEYKVWEKGFTCENMITFIYESF